LLEEPTLALAAAAAAAASGELARADRLADAAATAIGAAPSGAGHVHLRVELEASRATISLMRRDLEAAERHGRLASSLEAEPGPGRYGIGHVLWATALFWLGRCEDARVAMDEVWPHIDDRFVRALGAGILAAALLETGDGARAEHVAQGYLAAPGRAGTDLAPESVLAHLALGASLAERAELVQGEKELLIGIELSGSWGAPAQTAYGRLSLARLRLAQGRIDAAADLLQAAAPTVETARTKGLLAHVLMRTARLIQGAREHAAPGQVEALTPREHEVLRLLPSVLSQREIAGQLGVSRDTVKTHTRHLYDKLGVASRADAVRRAREQGLL
jgi:LuxR family maltose regulon positive regulatory protein